MNRTRTLQKQTGMNGVLLAFLLGMAGALAIFIPFLVVDKGFFVYCGDYNAQQIPFYLYVQQFIKTGGGTWSWATDLGSSVVSSYSFYNIGSPFLWLSTLFPTSWMPFLMVPLFVLKFGCISAAACLYLSRYSRTRNMAVICSVIYAFCGFNTYNIFFNHMLDPVVIFPLMLWALDGFIYNKKRGPFAFMVGLSLLNSYFFFIGNVVFILIYFFVKVATKEYRIKPKDFGLLTLEAVIGVGIGMVLALPSFYTLIANPRTSDFANGLGLMLYSSVHQYASIIKSIFLPPDPPYLANLFTEGVVNWTSMSFFLPVVSIGGVAAYCKARKWTGTKIILLISLIMALVPILNSSFYAFNSSYYARWYYMPILLMCFATMRSLEDPDIDLEYGAKVSLVATVAWIIFALLPTLKDGVWQLGAADITSKYWLTLFLAVGGAVAFYIIVSFYRKSVRFAPLLLSAVLAFSVVYSVVHIALGKFPQWERDQYIRKEMYEDSAVLELPEDQFYRTTTYEAYENLGLWMNRANLRTFNSTVNPSIMEFYPMVGVKRDVSSKPEIWQYALHGLLSVRYTLVPERNREKFEEEASNLGWTYWDSQGSYAIYENENYIPLGFTYDKYIYMDYLQYAEEKDRANLLMQGIGLSADQITRYGHLFEEELGDYQVVENTESESVTFQHDPLNYGVYTQDADQRRMTASYDVQADASGFTSKIRLEKENLVFFAVPYDTGFSATVNGQPVEVLKVSGGLMAVPAPAGDNEIVFRYRTPGFAMGGSITLLSLAALGLYIVLMMRAKNKRKHRQAVRKTVGQAAGSAANSNGADAGIDNTDTKEVLLAAGEEKTGEAQAVVVKPDEEVKQVEDNNSDAGAALPAGEQPEEK